MANSYLNILTFLLSTIFYYLALKPTLSYSLNTNQNSEEYTKYVSNNYMYLAIYVLLVILIQFMVNASVITSTCGGSVSDNIGAAGVLTFLPWILIFGVLVLVLSMYPGFKSAFADVVGYYYVSSSASKLLLELLINNEVKDKITDETGMSPEKQKSLETAADAIMKICGNASVLINQIVPSNFDQYWVILSPLMRDTYKLGSPTYDKDLTSKIQIELFDLVVTRDNIGEAMWYIYTGLLLTSIVQLKITTRGCTSNPATMEANYQKFLDQEQTTTTNKENASATYTTSS
jgi:hypothetical protein